MKTVNRWYLLGSVALSLLLCMAQINGSAILIFMCLAAFIVLMCYGCTKSFTLPLLLFFIPWSTLLKLNPDSFSFYTFGLIMVSMISAAKNWFRFRRYHLICGIMLLLLTLLAKIIHSSSITLDYICFMMMIVLFPVISEETDAEKYTFFDAVVFFAVGIVTAALCAEQFAGYANIREYIKVIAYQSIVRRCGFYNDPNFYAAHILAALGGCITLLLKYKAGAKYFVLLLLIAALIYSGLLSGSKSFVLTLAVCVILWIIELMKMRGKTGTRIAVVVGGLCVCIYVFTADIFKSLIDIITSRFDNATDMDTFTTGRSELWQTYYTSIIYDAKVLLIGKGFTNVKINTRASHNTLIQMVFQFGVIGSPILIGWIACFFGRIKERVLTNKKQFTRLLILLTGIFLPWMALDMLFFDEFFMMQWFCLLGIYEIYSAKPAAQLDIQNESLRNAVPYED